MSKFLLCIPTYNECENILEIIERALITTPEVDILVIDDNSPDGTGRLVQNLMNSKVTLLSRSEKEGLGPAYIAGFQLAIAEGYDFVIEMDADGSHQPEQLPTLIRAAEKADLVLGTRWMAGGQVINWPPLRRAISRAGTWYAKRALQLPYRDLTSGYRIIRTSLLKQINLHSITTRGYGFQIEIALQSHDLGAQILEVPITFIERARGRSKMSHSIVLEALVKTTQWGFARRINRR